MGYTTRHALTVRPTEDYPELSVVKQEEIIKKLRDSNEDAYYCLSSDGSTAEGGKWYEHESDLRAFSKQYPRLLFILEGEGEENEDMWKEYYVNGKMQKAKAVISFEPYDEKKLV